MKLKDEIVELVNKKYDEILLLFQDADRIPLSYEAIKRLRDEILPLFEDIKTEVSDIQRQIHEMDPDKKKKKKRKPEDEREPWDSSPEDQQLIQKLLEDIRHSNRLTKELQKEILKLPGGAADHLIDSADDVLPNLASILIIWEKTIGKLIDGVKNRGEKTEYWTLFIKWLDEQTNKLESDLDGAVDDLKRFINDALVELADKLALCCQQINDKLDNQQSVVDDIDRIVKNLDPVTQSNQSLEIDARLRAIQAEISVIRGLL
jgi:chromosome segregation ATPase